MTWIQTISVEQAEGPLQAAYQAVYSFYPPEYSCKIAAVTRSDGTADSIVCAHSLIPEALRHAMSTLGVLLSQELPLSRQQHEMIATVVSALNRCFY
jgi:hypothetical protein